MEKQAHLASLMHQILRAFGYLHNKLHVCHGSISSANVLLKISSLVNLANVHEDLLKRPRRLRIPA